MYLYSLCRWTLIPALCLTYEGLTNDEIEHMLWVIPMVFSLGLLIHNIILQSYGSDNLLYSVFVLLGIRDLILNPNIIDNYVLWIRFLWITGYRMIMITYLLYIIQSLISFIYYHIDWVSIIGAGLIVGTILMYRK
jgi:hypothetical protein